MKTFRPLVKICSAGIPVELMWSMRELAVYRALPAPLQLVHLKIIVGVVAFKVATKHSRCRFCTTPSTKVRELGRTNFMTHHGTRRNEFSLWA